MARAFVAGSSQYLEFAGAIVTGYPLTLACWFYGDNTLNSELMSVANNAATTDHFTLRASGSTGGDPIHFIRRSAAAGSNIAITSTGFSNNTWAHCCGVGRSATSGDCYINGGSKGSNTTSVTPGSLNRTAIGRLPTSSPSYSTGRIAEAAIWNTDLSDAEVKALASGIAPPFIRPANLAAYWPIWGLHSPEIDLTANNRQMTVTGATLADHAPVEMFSHRRFRTDPEIVVPIAVLSRRTLYLRTGSRGALGGL